MERRKYKSPVSAGELPLIAIDPVPENLGEYVSKDKSKVPQLALDALNNIMGKVAESGCNCILFGGTFEYMDNVLNYAADHHLKAILGPVYLHDSPKHSQSVVKRYTKVASDNTEETNYRNKLADTVSTWLVYDQPRYNAWGDAFVKNIPEDTIFNELTVGYRVVHELDNTRTVYFNLAAPEPDSEGKYSEEWIGTSKAKDGESGTDYGAYLNNLDLLFKPSLWSYDFYPCVIKGAATTDKPLESIRYTTFFEYLKAFREQAAKTDRPFWAYCMTQGHRCYRVGASGNKTLLWTQPTPTLGLIRFEAFSALAYGAQGIVYWKYGLSSDKKSSPNEYLSFESAPLSLNIAGDSASGTMDRITLSTNPVYDDIKTVNEEIKKFQHIFLDCNVKSIMDINKSLRPILFTSYECLISVLTNQNILISTITKANAQGLIENYYVIVNKNPFEEVSVTLGIAGGYRGAILTDNPETEFENSNISIGSRISKTIPAGGWLIVRWSKY